MLASTSPIPGTSCARKSLTVVWASGHFFVLDRSSGKTRGQYLFHASEEGKLPNWDTATQQQLLSDKAGTLERVSADGRTLKVAYAAAGLELDHRG